MTRSNNTVRVVVLLFTLGIFLTGSAYAGSAVVGSVAGSVNATAGGHELVSNATIFSGDSLQVNDGVAVITLGRGSRMVFGHQSTVSFSREADSVTAVLGQGNVSLFYPEAGVGLQVKVGEVTIAPAKGFKTLGEVAMANGTLVVTTKEGLLRVQGNGPAVELAKGKTIVVMPKAAAGPQGGGGGQGHSVSGLELASLGVGVTGVILGAFGYRAAVRAQDATAAGNAAYNSAQQALIAAVAAGCAVNKLPRATGAASPFTPPSPFPAC